MSRHQSSISPTFITLLSLPFSSSLYSYSASIYKDETAFIVIAVSDENVDGRQCLVMDTLESALSLILPRYFYVVAKLATTYFRISSYVIRRAGVASFLVSLPSLHCAGSSEDMSAV